MESRRIAAIPGSRPDLPEADLAAIASIASELEVSSGDSVAREGGFLGMPCLRSRAVPRMS